MARMADAAAIQGVYSIGTPKPILSTRMKVTLTAVMKAAGMPLIGGASPVRSMLGACSREYNASGEEVLSAKSYVQRGLYHRYDAIENGGYGIHDTALNYAVDYSEVISLRLTREIADEIMDTLTPREKIVLEYRCYDDLTLEEVGEILNLSRNRVKQIEAKALRKMRHPSRSKKITKFSRK